jgi:hypothetical protein
MTNASLFDAAIRVVGIWLLVRCVQSLVYVVYYAALVHLSSEVAGQYLLAALSQCVLGLLLIGAGGRITRFVYKNAQARHMRTMWV